MRSTWWKDDPWSTCNLQFNIALCLCHFSRQPNIYYNNSGSPTTLSVTGKNFTADLVLVKPIKNKIEPCNSTLDTSQKKAQTLGAACFSFVELDHFNFKWNLQRMSHRIAIRTLCSIKSLQNCKKQSISRHNDVSLCYEHSFH